MAAMPPPTTASSNFQSASNSFNALPLAVEKHGTESGREGMRCGDAFESTQGLQIPHYLLSYRNAGDCAKSGAWRMHRIAQHANTRHADFYGVSCDERANSCRRAAGDKVTGEQCHHARNPAHQKGHGIHHERSAGRLAESAIDVRLDQDVARIELRFNVWSDGAKRVKSFGAGELHIALLQVARSDVVDTGVTQDIGKRVGIVVEMSALLAEHEGELGIVIGKECAHLDDDANSLSYVLGYTCVNDVTARDLQKSDVQFTRAKGFDTFCPVGPHIETQLDPRNILVETYVNGGLRQSASTSLMVYPVAFLVRWISRMMTLFPGDLIASGTPAGVGPLVA